MSLPALGRKPDFFSQYPGLKARISLQYRCIGQGSRDTAAESGDIVLNSKVNLERIHARHAYTPEGRHLLLRELPGWGSAQQGALHQPVLWRGRADRPADHPAA